MCRILCYGDSNTYGYDPRGIFGGRYARAWCEWLGEACNLGENGRTVPRTEGEYASLYRELAAHPAAEVLLIMLGTNDILMGRDTGKTAERMGALLDRLAGDFPRLRVVLLAPPQTALPESSMKELADRYRKLAGSRGLGFLNPQSWGLPLAFDGVHLTEEGHRLFAEKLKAELFP